MADVKISALTDATALASADEFAIVQSGVTKRITGGEIFGAPLAIGGTTPAAITGTTITASTRFVGAIDGTVGATTPAAGAFTTLSATGLITSTVTGAVLADTSGGTNSLYVQFGNTGGNSFFGVDNSTGASLSSGTAYAFAIYTPTEIAGVIAGTKVTATTATGLAVTGVLSATGAVQFGLGGGAYQINSVTAVAAQNFMQFKASTGDSVVGTIIGRDASSQTFRIQNSENAPVDIYSNNAVVGSFSSTGLAVTGVLSITPSTGETVTLARDGAGPYFGTSTDHNLRIIRNNSTILTLASTGLAVTGVLSATGAISSSGTGSIGVFSSSNNADTNSVNVVNTSNTAASDARLLLQVGGTSGGDPHVAFFNGTSLYAFGADTSDGMKIKLAPNTPSGTAVFTIDPANGNTTLGGSITTSAPTGGAGAWELGIANAVSPTSPNRTLTVEIGGTVYYIHAKTTND